MDDMAIEVYVENQQSGAQRREQPPLVPLTLDISGEPETPRPSTVTGDRCTCCGLRTTRLWDGGRSAMPEPHAVCTLCYLAGHLDSPTAAHGRLAYLPGLAMADIHHLQRCALLALKEGTREQRRDGQRLWRWLMMHTREVEQAWGSARAGEFAAAMQLLPPMRRGTLQARLAGCALILPHDAIDDISLLLPEGKSAAAVLGSRSWATYTRSDLYVEPS